MIAPNSPLPFALNAPPIPQENLKFLPRTGFEPWTKTLRVKCSWPLDYGSTLPWITLLTLTTNLQHKYEYRFWGPPKFWIWCGRGCEGVGVLGVRVWESKPLSRREISNILTLGLGVPPKFWNFCFAFAAQRQTPPICPKLQRNPN